MGKEKQNYQFQFGPETAINQLNRERMVALAGGRALKMQLAHPLVAQSIRDTEFLVRDPLGRLLQTAEAGVNIIFGTLEESNDVAHGINMAHKSIQGYLEDAVGIHLAGTPYSAKDQKIIKWVAATLIDSTIVGYETFVKPVEDEKKDEYVSNAVEVFAKVGLKSEDFPITYAGIQEYIAEMIKTEEVKVGDLARDLAPFALLSHTPTTNLFMTGFRAFTNYTMPPELAKQYGDHLAPWQKKLLKQSAKAIQKAVPYLPKKIRYFTKYREARKLMKENKTRQG